jgi:hypothetical protein
VNPIPIEQATITAKTTTLPHPETRRIVTEIVAAEAHGLQPWEEPRPR